MVGRGVVKIASISEGFRAGRTLSASVIHLFQIEQRITGCEFLRKYEKTDERTNTTIQESALEGFHCQFYAKAKITSSSEGDLTSRCLVLEIEQ